MKVLPRYWHYDILLGLKVMAEAGLIGDPRCVPALDLLESKCLPGGGWPAEEKFYNASPKAKSGRERVDWGKCHANLKVCATSFTSKSRRRPNPWITTDALFVLRAAGRIPS